MNYPFWTSCGMMLLGVILLNVFVILVWLEESNVKAQENMTCHSMQVSPGISGHRSPDPGDADPMHWIDPWMRHRQPDYRLSPSNAAASQGGFAPAPLVYQVIIPGRKRCSLEVGACAALTGTVARMNPCKVYRSGSGGGRKGHSQTSLRQNADAMTERFEFSVAPASSTGSRSGNRKNPRNYIE